MTKLYATKLLPSLVVLSLTWFVRFGEAFIGPSYAGFRLSNLPLRNDLTGGSDEIERNELTSPLRRDLLNFAALASGSIAFGGLATEPASAAVGSLPEFGDTNAIIQGLTVDVVDAAQQESMINFLVNGFDFQVLRKRIIDSVEETWLGFGPEQLSIPSDFELPVSSFAQYGGHASIRVRYDSKATKVLYRQGDPAPGNNIAYLQLGVPTYRISQMVANGGNILDAYGLVNVVSPSGLPIRGIVGISPDPIMLVAINCKDVQGSKSFYEQLGFTEQEYPFARPSKGTTMFEPDKPKNAVYMAPSPNCMGVLLLPTKKKANITPNPSVSSLTVVYNPSEGAGGQELLLKDPSEVGIRFQSAQSFTAEEKITR